MCTMEMKDFSFFFLFPSANGTFSSFLNLFIERSVFLFLLHQYANKKLSQEGSDFTG